MVAGRRKRLPSAVVPNVKRDELSGTAKFKENVILRMELHSDLAFRGDEKRFHVVGGILTLSLNVCTHWFPVRRADIRIRAERKAGQLLKEIERTPRKGAGRPKTIAVDGQPQFPKEHKETPFQQAKREAHISDDQAKRWQRIAAIPVAGFKDRLHEALIPTTSGILRNRGRTTIRWLTAKTGAMLRNPAPMTGNFALGAPLWRFLEASGSLRRPDFRTAAIGAWRFAAVTSGLCYVLPTRER
jgi:hypothetical protein